MTRRELNTARWYRAALDRQRFLHTMRARYRGDMRYCYARMMSRAPETLYREKTDPLKFYRQQGKAA